MSKVITSTSKHWPGTVTIATPMFLPQAEAIDEALGDPAGYEGKDRIPFTQLDKWHFPAILACVEKWNIEGYPEAPTFETIPLDPRPESHAFIDWLFSEIKKVYLGEAEVPNE